MSSWQGWIARCTLVAFVSTIAACAKTPTIRFAISEDSTLPLSSSARDAALRTCGEVSGDALISTPRAPSSGQILSLASAPAIIVRCDYMGNWFAPRRQWIVLAREGDAFTTRGPWFDSENDARAYAMDTTAFQNAEHSRVDAHLKRFNQLQALYVKLCFTPPFTGGLIENKDEHHAVITCRSEGNPSARLVRKVTIP